MKVCSLRRFLKYTLLISLTSFVTTVVFHLVRKTNHVHPRSIHDDDSSYEESEVAEKIDWHDWKLIAREESRQGIGEHGKAASMPPDHSKKKYNDLYGTNGYNALMSDFISINRSLPDIRHPDCKYKKYRRVLPDVSVVVPFHNEHWSTLLRTAYSVLNRSPPKLIKEIILVDDSSTKAHCKKPLDKYVEQNLPKVKVIHLEKRQGLIRARLAGAKVAKGEVLLFLDSHTEANINWLPPLLDPIAADYRTCVCPFIDVIDFETFEYKPQDEGARGAFNWEFFYKRLPLLPEDHLDPTKPFKSPVMAGGLFAISVKFFWELGGYDPGLDIWGGEQYELSFKIWQCGGTMVDAPCSRVGHIYRKFAPFPNPQIGDFVGRNYRRVAEVWMDEYAEYLYKRRPEYRKISPGNLTDQRKIREKLNCKPFKWFMENVAFDLTKHYPLIEPPDYGNGQIKSVLNRDWCIAANKNNQSVELAKCDVSSESGIYKEFLLSWHKDIQVKDASVCLDVSSYGPKVPVKLYPCHFDQGNQLWKYNSITKQLIFGHSTRCIDHDVADKAVFLTDCSLEKDTQKWSITNINEDALKKWSETIPS